MEVIAEIVEKHEGGWYYVILTFQQGIEAGGCIFLKKRHLFQNLWIRIRCMNHGFALKFPLIC